MRALELTTYPKLERPRTGDEIMPYQKARRREMALERSKRLTDAELAAEYHGQASRVVLIEKSSPHKSAGPSAYRKLEALHRFATLPHYDKEQP